MMIGLSHVRIFLATGLLASTVACGDSGGSGGSGGGSSNTGGSTTNTGGSTTNTGGSTSNTGGSAPAGAIVINEIQAHSPEWLEIGNNSAAAIDLSDYGVCDEDVSGACETASAMRFPAGTSLAPGAYLIVITDQTDPTPGPHTLGCPAGVDSCFYATWQVSAVDGETIRVIDPSDAEVASLTYTPNATVDTTESWSRIPDLTGNPAKATPTPGAANMP